MLNRMVKFFPNLLTLGNLFCGFLGLVLVAREQMVLAVYCVAVALVLDFLDGFVAKLLHAQSELGVQLDSLADLITFGTLPGFMLFQLISITHGYYFIDIGNWPLDVLFSSSVAGLIPIAAAYRLGVFNLDKTETEHFKGLPVPAMTMFVVGIPVVLEAHYHLNFYHPLSDQFVAMLGEERRWDPSDIWLVNLMGETGFYYGIIAFSAFMMVSKIPMLSIKFNGLSWQKNKWRYGVLIWALVSYIIFLIPYLSLPFSYGLIDYLVLPIFMLGYFLLSWIYAIFGHSKESNAIDEIQS